MTGPLPRPLTETRSTVTLRKRDWKALIAFLEDIEDRAAMDRGSRARGKGRQGGRAAGLSDRR